MSRPPTWKQIKIENDIWNVSSDGQYHCAEMVITIFEPDQDGEVDIEVQGRVVHVPLIALQSFVDTNRRK